ncbi:MAG: hypothetical protein AB7O50_12190 [Pseudolabrys sp.]
MLTAMSTGVPGVGSAFAQEMSAEEARAFVTGKLFSYNCFEGTRGAGRIHADGSVVGTVQFQGAGPVRNAFLPANTLRVKGGAVCASLRGMPVEPCFNLHRIDNNSFRGSISGLGFASCEFTRMYSRRVNVAARARVTKPSARSTSPIALRPSLAAVP